MEFLWNKLTEWLKEMLVGGVMSNLTGLFDSINDQVSEIAGTVGATSQGWNSGVFSMVQSLSNNVVVPIAGVLLAIERTNYEVVYAAVLHQTTGKAVPELLNDIFYRFNMERPDDFYGHSLSVSDIVALKVDGIVTAHYVDRYGWQELHGFLSDQPLRNAEMMLEDDYGMIDGIINNGKREPDEERPSVVKQLREQPEYTPKTSSKGRDGPAIE